MAKNHVVYVEHYSNSLARPNNVLLLINGIDVPESIIDSDVIRTVRALFPDTGEGRKELREGDLEVLPPALLRVWRRMVP